jgi:hypothetical protein
MQNLKQKLDRTDNILHHNSRRSRSADLLRLNYMASKLFFLRDITSKNYEDYFSARGNYATWSLDHQSRYSSITNQALDEARVAAETCRSQHETSTQKCQQLMTDVVMGDDGSPGGKDKRQGGKDKKREGEPAAAKSKSRRRASVVVSAQEGVQLRATEEVSEFKDMRGVALTYLARYQQTEEDVDVDVGIVEMKCGGKKDDGDVDASISRKPFFDCADDDEDGKNSKEHVSKDSDNNADTDKSNGEDEKDEEGGEVVDMESMEDDCEHKPEVS